MLSSWGANIGRERGSGMTLRRGAYAGIVGALAMSALFVVLRVALGWPTPSELFADLSAPFIPVHLFGILIGLARGYTPLKIIGFTSVLFGQLVVGAIGGAIYATRARRSDVFLTAYVAALWAISALAFFPVLVTSYHGYPASSAVPFTLLALALGYALYGLTTRYLVALVSDTPLTSTRAIIGYHNTDTSRGKFAAGGIALGAVAVLAGAGARLVSLATFSYDGRMYRGSDVAAITPNERFYSVTKNFADPHVVDANVWRLAVRGAVDAPRVYDFAAIGALPYVEQETTLMCINNEPDGGLMSNALWRGVPLRALIGASRPHDGVLRVLLHAADNYIDTIPYDKAMDPGTLVAYRMNGEPLPSKHGFPARAIVPGWFGEKNVKWITAIELVTAPVKGFYERQGWGPDFRVPTHARFDAPDFAQPIAMGANVTLRGVAFCGDRGVSNVEVSTDGERTWQRADFASHDAPYAWRLWRFSWHAPRAGTYHLAVRAYDKAGIVQPASVRSTEPQGATGYHRVVARVS